MMALVDTGSQISALTKGFCLERGLQILPLRNLMKGVLHLKGLGDITIPCKGYVEANLTNEDVYFWWLQIISMEIKHQYK